MQTDDTYSQFDILYPEERSSFYIFADIRGFTEWSNKNLSEVEDLLNIAYPLAFDIFGEVMSTRYLKRVVKFLGDGFFAVNEYDKEFKRKPFLATFLNTLNDIVIYRRKFKENIKSSTLHGKTNLNISFGVSYGKSRRFNLKGFPKDYVSDKINLASRLCQEAEPGEIVFEIDLKEYILKLREMKLIRIQHSYDQTYKNIKGFGSVEAFIIDRGVAIKA